MMTKRKWLLATLSAALCTGLCAAGVLLETSRLPNVAHAESGTQTEATAVEFDGVSTTGVYSLEKYAGFNGSYWILDTSAATVNAGQAGRRLGSGANDNRDVTITLKVNSEIAADASLRLWAEFYGEASSASISVNGVYIAADGSEIPESEENKSVNLFGINGFQNVWVPTSIPVSLVAGENVVEIDLISGYDAWMEGFEFFASNAKLGTDGTPVAMRPQEAVSFTNRPTVNSTSWGKETADSPASATYRVYAEEAGAYKFTLGVEAGDNTANNAYISVNGGEQTQIAFDTSNGWGKVTENDVILTLQQGVNTVEIGQRIEGEGKANWWLKSMRAAYVTTRGLTVNAENAKTSYNPYEKLDKTGLIVSYYDTENAENDRELALTDVTFTEPALTVKGQNYTVSLTYTDGDGVLCRGEYTVSTVSEAIESDGDTFAYAGAQTDRYTLIGEKGNVGLVKTGDAGIAWIMNVLTEPNGYSIGSGGGGDGRQLTMKIKVDSTVAGDAYLTIYGQVDHENNQPHNGTTVTVGDVQIAVDWAAMYDETLRQTVIPVTLAEGMNEITVATEQGYNMWLTGFDLRPVPEQALLLDKSGVKTVYLPYEELDLSGLTAAYKRGDEDAVEVDFDDLTIDSSAYNADVLGTYTITVSYTPEGGQNAITAELSVRVGAANAREGGEGSNRTEKPIAYSGSALAIAPLWAKDSAVGFNGSYWVQGKVNAELYGDGYKFGSSATEDRKLTLVWKIESTVSGKVTVALYGEFYAMSGLTKLTVNDSDVDAFHPIERVKGTSGQTYIEFEVALKEGTNYIELALPRNYDAWLFAYSVSEVEEDVVIVPPDPVVDPPAEETKKGCGSVLNGLVVAPIALAVAGVCILLRKKNS